MLRTVIGRGVDSTKAEFRDRLLCRNLVVSPLISSVTPSRLRGFSTGLKDKLPSGVVGAVDPSQKTPSSESTTEGDREFMVI